MSNSFRLLAEVDVFDLFDEVASAQVTLLVQPWLPVADIARLVQQKFWRGRSDRAATLNIFILRSGVLTGWIGCPHSRLRRSFLQSPDQHGQFAAQFAVTSFGAYFEERQQTPDDQELPLHAGSAAILLF